jgi:hypothetical protein
VVVLAVLAAAAMLFWRHPGATESTAPPRLARPEQLTAAEKLYGLAPARRAGVRYRADVVMPPAGADAIRGPSPDGVTWTLDPEARGVRDIAPGKVLFLTNRLAGRVLGVQRRAEGLTVVLGPVELTDVIQDGEFAIDTPVDLGQALSYPLPEIQSTPAQVPRIIAGPRPPGAFAMPAAFEPDQAMRFRTTPLVGSAGIGVRITADTPNGLQFLGEAVLYLNAPQLHFVLSIHNARVTVCEVSLTGAAGLLMTFQATSSAGMRANINERAAVPVDFSIPVLGMGVPFAVTVRQTFVLQTAFSANGALRARGYYGFTGGLRLGYRDGQFSVGGPTGLSVKESLLQSAAGVSIGAAGLVMTHQAKIIVGIGAFGFATGPYVALASSVAVSRGSDIGIVVCKGATLSMDLAAGIGYIIPQPVTNAINFILRGLNLRQITGSGGFQAPATPIVKATSYTPNLKICAP